MANTLYYGDNLEVLRRYIHHETVDLVYLDPPFNSNRDYNVIFKDQSGERSPAQIKAFTDTWNWAAVADLWESFHEICPVPRTVDLMSGFINTLGRNDVTAYLLMMAPRLYQLHRVLKPTGSLYLHCDPTASHYLKIILDTIFGPQNFRNEIVWKRTTGKANSSVRLTSDHDVILNYRKSEDATFHIDQTFIPYDQSDLDEKTAGKYSQTDSDGRRYQLTDLTNPNHNRPNLTYEFMGVTKVWRWTRERMQAAFDAGLVIQPNPNSVPRYKRYLDEQRGRPLGDTWTDIPPINSQAVERLGYPTQKPLPLLTRLIKTASNPGDVVLDPFCGCGTAIVAAQSLDRQWIGIDIMPIATSLIQKRMWDSFGAKDRRLLAKDDPAVTKAFDVIGLPVDTDGANRLFRDDHKDFEMWAVG